MVTHSIQNSKDTRRYWEKALPDLSLATQFTSRCDPGYPSRDILPISKETDLHILLSPFFFFHTNGSILYTRYSHY